VPVSRPPAMVDGVAAPSDVFYSVMDSAPRPPDFPVRPKNDMTAPVPLMRE
jgi:hypothetical protein